MLSPERIEELADRIVHGHQEAFVRDLTGRLIRALASDGDLSVKDMRLLEQVAAANRDATTRALNAASGRISREAREAITSALADSAAWDLAAVGAAHAGSMLPGASALSARVGQQTAEGLARIIARDNLALASRAQSVWYDVTGEAISRYNAGAYPTGRIISDAVRRLRDEGFVTIDYASGVKSALDVAVRRHVVSQAGQASARITDDILDATGHELVMTWAHLGARPDHAVWQGRAFRRGGAGVVEGVRYPGFEEETGYGTVTGIYGAHCRHSHGPYWPGITELPEIPKPPGGMSEEEYYDLTQKQRGYERAIRTTKTEIADLRAAGLDDTTARLKLGAQHKRLKAFCDKTGLPRIPSREKAYSIGEQPRALRSSRYIQVGRSLGAAAFKDPIRLPDGSYTKLVEGSRITGIVVIAGHGVKRQIDEIDTLVAVFGGKRGEWTKRRGTAHVVDLGLDRKAEVHWYQEPSVGRVKMKVVRYHR